VYSPVPTLGESKMMVWAKKKISHAEWEQISEIFDKRLDAFARATGKVPEMLLVQGQSSPDRHLFTVFLGVSDGRLFPLLFPGFTEISADELPKKPSLSGGDQTIFAAMFKTPVKSRSQRLSGEPFCWR